MLALFSIFFVFISFYFLSAARTTLASLGAFATATVSIVGVAAAGLAAAGTTVS